MSSDRAARPLAVAPSRPAASRRDAELVASAVKSIPPPGGWPSACCCAGVRGAVGRACEPQPASANEAAAPAPRFASSSWFSWVDDGGSVVEHEHAAVGEPGGVGGQDGGLRAPFGLEGGGRERGRLDDAGERRAAGRGVEQVVGGAAVARRASCACRCRSSRRRRRVTSKTCSGGPPNGSATSSRRGAPPKRRSPPQSTAKSPRIRSAIRSANRPLASPPESNASPGGRRTRCGRRRAGA